MRQAQRKDGPQARIVASLEKGGASVDVLPADARSGRPDLLVGYQGQDFLLEVKAEDGELSAEQEAWHRVWKGRPIAVVRNELQALRVVGIPWSSSLLDTPVHRRERLEVVPRALRGRLARSIRKA